MSDKLKFSTVRLKLECGNMVSDEGEDDSYFVPVIEQTMAYTDIDMAHMIPERGAEMLVFEVKDCIRIINARLEMLEEAEDV